MKKLVKKKSFLLLLILILFTALQSKIYAEKGQIGLGYDEGIAARYFFADNMGLQANMALDYRGGHDATQFTNNNNEVKPEYNFGLGIGFLINLFSSNYVFLDGLAQVAYFHDGERSDENLGDRDRYFLRLALAPEFLLGEHLGLGMRVGFEAVFKGETKYRPNNNGPIEDSGDATLNMKFFGPANPFDGPILGLSVYVYFGG